MKRDIDPFLIVICVLYGLIAGIIIGIGIASWLGAAWD